MTLLRKVGGKIAIRTFATERLKGLLATSKGAVYAADFDKLVSEQRSERAEGL